MGRGGADDPRSWVADLRHQDRRGHERRQNESVSRGAGADDVGALRGVRVDGCVADRTRAQMVGPRKLLASGEWLAEVQWVERHGVRRRGHRPDLIGGVATNGPLLPIEVELAFKSTQRLRAILGLHARWITTGKARAVIYICATATVAERVSDEARQVGLTAEHTTLRVELLDTIRAAAITARHAHPADALEVVEPTVGSS